MTALEQAKVEALGTSGSVTLNSKTTLSTLGVIWLEDFRKKGRATGTVERYESSLKGAIERELGALTLRELTNAGLRQFVQAIADAGHLAEAHTCRQVVRSVLGYAVHRGVCEPQLINFDGLTLPLPRSKPRAIHLDELEQLRALIIADVTDRGRGRRAERRTMTS